ncbi:MAG: galactose-1-phosphate uridylyltransferase [Acidobacteria bacterium]|nr:galactose-1-phosphate uridylyltransferase [Acidobacteriota bacterium]
MPELRQDPSTKEWVIIAKERAKRPHEFQRPASAPRASVSGCVFCPGSEDKTPPELWRFPYRSAAWEVRVVPNKFPALSSEASGVRQEIAPLYHRMDGFGYHEVIIETPHHDRPMPLMEHEEVKRVLLVFRDRYWALREDWRVKLVLIFKNHGPTAGTSLEHPHCQVIATSIIPSHIRRKYEVATQHYDDTGRCIYCDIVHTEKESGERVVRESEHFLVLEPFASRSPFETWLAPLRHNSCLGRITDPELDDLASVLRETLARLYYGLNNPDFNLVVHTAPVEDETKPYYLWHIQILPRLATPAGFEIGSGIYVNPCVLEEAAAFLRGVRVEPAGRSASR